MGIGRLKICHAYNLESEEGEGVVWTTRKPTNPRFEEDWEAISGLKQGSPSGLNGGDLRRRILTRAVKKVLFF
ncbi:unnamed protein product, partial [Musa acuminata subsp. burmannicoides]